jgi:hypothetical protein
MSQTNIELLLEVMAINRVIFKRDGRPSAIKALEKPTSNSIKGIIWSSNYRLQTRSQNTITNEFIILNCCHDNIFRFQLIKFGTVDTPINIAGRMSLTLVYCTRRDRLVCTTRSRLHVYHP